MRGRTLRLFPALIAVVLAVNLPAMASANQAWTRSDRTLQLSTPSGLSLRTFSRGLAREVTEPGQVVDELRHFESHHLLGLGVDSKLPVFDTRSFLTVAHGRSTGLEHASEGENMLRFGLAKRQSKVALGASYFSVSSGLRGSGPLGRQLLAQQDLGDVGTGDGIKLWADLELGSLQLLPKLIDVQDDGTQRKILEISARQALSDQTELMTTFEQLLLPGPATELDAKRSNFLVAIDHPAWRLALRDRRAEESGTFQRIERNVMGQLKLFEDTQALPGLDIGLRFGETIYPTDVFSSLEAQVAVTRPIAVTSPGRSFLRATLTYRQDEERPAVNYNPFGLRLELKHQFNPG